MVGVGPDITHYSLQWAMDTYVFSPKEANAAQQAVNIAELALHVIPLGAAADNFAQGNYGEAAISLAGDAAMLLTGGGSRAIATTLQAKKYVQSASATTRALQTAGIITEASVAGIRGVQRLEPIPKRRAGRLWPNR